MLAEIETKLSGCKHLGSLPLHPCKEAAHIWGQPCGGVRGAGVAVRVLSLQVPPIGFPEPGGILPPGLLATQQLLIAASCARKWNRQIWADPCQSSLCSQGPRC